MLKIFELFALKVEFPVTVNYSVLFLSF